MMEIAVAAGIAIISAVVSFAVSWGYSLKGLDVLMKQIERHSTKHEDHYRHAGDVNLHWTPRERDALTKTLESIDAKIEELLKRER